MHVLGVDVGTTHCKAGLIDQAGSLIALAHRSTPIHQAGDGAQLYDPDALWSTVAATIRDVTSQTTSSRIAAIGIAGMAETGMLLDARTGAAHTPFIPWFDRRSTAQAEQIAHASDRFERFCVTGQYPNFKSGLAKLLWLRDEQHMRTDAATWIAAPDYMAYRLTDVLATDYTLATRSYAFRLDQQTWDADWLQQWKFRTDLFPAVYPSGVAPGSVTAACAGQLGLTAGTPVAIAGHDHVCAALAVGAIEPPLVFDSVGTAETLVGAVAARPLGRGEFESGLTYGCHVVRDRLYWMGGLSAAGGSIEWLRALLGDPAVSYTELAAVLDQAGSDPTGILYFPYLLGSGTPHPDHHAQAALIGLRSEHTRAHIAKAVVEGAAFELEFIRRAAEQGIGTPINTLIAAGGGTRNAHWMQIKADVGNCRIDVPASTEATVRGAALVAGIGCGLYRDAADAVQHTSGHVGATYRPDPARHTIYRRFYEQGYAALQAPLRHTYQHLAHMGAPTA